MTAPPTAAVSPHDLRRAGAADAAGVAALEAVFPGDRLSLRSVRRLIASPAAAVLVHDGASGIVGAIVLLTRRDSKAARIYSLAVHPAARGGGLGRRLVAAAEAEARARGCREMRLEVRCDNDAARRLYARMGYDEVGRTAGYYDDGATALRLRRLL